MRNIGSEVSSKGWGAFALGLLGAAFALIPTQAEAGEQPKGRGAASPQVSRGFVENKGQWDARARFHGAGPGVSMWLEDKGVVLDYARPKASKSRYLGHAVEMRFLGAQTGSFAGHDRRGTIEILKSGQTGKSGKFGKVVHSSVYKGIDFVTYFDGKTPRYDFVVAPGVDPKAIRLGFNGTKNVRVVDADTLAIGTVFGEQKIDGLFAYQTVSGKKKPISVRFQKNAQGEVTFGLGAYDKSKLLVIDPLVYGTYFGGNAGFDEVRGIAADLTGGTYVTGYTLSRQFPRNAGPYGFDLKGGRDAFVSKLQGDAYANDYSIYLGGDDDDQGNFINVDASGNVFVAGTTDSSDFPGSTNPNVGSGRMWLMRFAPIASATNTSLRSLTPFRDLNNNGTIDAGEGDDADSVVFRFGRDENDDEGINNLSGLGIPRPEGAAAANITRVVTGGSSNGVLLADIDANDNGGLANGEFGSSFYATVEYRKDTATFSVNQATSGYVVSRSTSQDPSFVVLSGVAVDLTGNIYLHGFLAAITSSDTATDPTPIFDTTPGVLQDTENEDFNGRLQRGFDQFVRKYSPTGQIVYSTLLGGSADDTTDGAIPTRNVDDDGFQIFDFAGPTIAADLNGNAYVVGEAGSFDFPRTRNTIGQVFPAAASAGTLTKISFDGRAVLYSTNINIGGRATPVGISVDPRGQAYITGTVSRRMIFNTTLGDPPVPNAAADIIGTIPTTPDAIRPTYESLDQPEIITDDAFLLVFNADASNYVHGTYIGGILDEGVFAPYTDSFGDTFVYGWTDTYREYAVIASTAGAQETRYRRPGNMNPFITPGAFKAVPETINQALYQGEFNVAYGAFAGGSAAGQAPYDTSGAPFVPFPDIPQIPGGGNIIYLRDGFILRYRLALPLLQSLTLAPNTIPGGDASGSGIPASTTATVTLSAPAPEGGASVTVTIDNGSIASFNPSSSVTSTTINIAPGATTASFPVYSYPVQDVANVQIRADYAGNVKVASLTVKPWLQSLSILTSTSVGGGGSAGPPSTFPTGTVRLEAPAQGNTRVVLTSTSSLIRFANSAGQLLTTGEVIVPSGQQTATFEYQTLATDTVVAARINATLLGVTRSQNITITPARLNRIVFNPSTIAGGSTTNGQVFLDGRAATPRRIKVEVQNVAIDSGYSIAGSTTDPRVAIITIESTSQGPNSNFGSFALTTGFETANVTRTVRAVQIDANGNEVGNAVTGTIVVTAQSIGSVAVSPATVESGGVVTATVTLSTPAPVGGVKVSLRSSNTTLVPIDVTLTVPAGSATASYSIKIGTNNTAAAASVTLTAFRGSATNGSAKTTTVTVNPLTYTVTVAPTALFGGNSATGTITLPRTQTVAISFTISAPAGSGVTVSPATVTIPSGSLTGTFTINTTAVTTTRTVNLTVTTGTQAAKTVGVTIRAIQVSSISLSRATIRSGETTRLTVTLDGAPSVDTTIPLTFSNSSLISFPPVVIRAGQTSATVTSSPAARVPRTLTTSITASLGGNSVSTTLTVTR